jgi:hypothetical protein
MTGPGILSYIEHPLFREGYLLLEGDIKTLQAALEDKTIPVCILPFDAKFVHESFGKEPLVFPSLVFF